MNLYWALQSKSLAVLSPSQNQKQEASWLSSTQYYIVAPTELTGHDQSILQAPWQLALVLGAAQASVLSSGQKLQPRLWRCFFTSAQKWIFWFKFRSCPALSGQGWGSFGVLLTGNFFLMSSKDMPTIAFWNFWASWKNIQNGKMHLTVPWEFLKWILQDENLSLNGEWLLFTATLHWNSEKCDTSTL